MAAIPPFLFRAASDQSRGANTAARIDPLEHYGTADYHKDLDSFPRCDICPMLADHFEYMYDRPSEFSSWSISILWVLVHAVRKATCFEETNVLIYIMDTRKLPIGRAHSAVQLVKDYRLEWIPNVRDYTQGEYLVHGELHHTNGLWQAVRLETLIDGGLYTTFPTLEKEDLADSLYQRMVGLRMGYLTDVKPMNADIVRVYEKLVGCFDAKWQGVLMVALVMSMRRDLSEEGIEPLWGVLRSMSLPRLWWEEDIGLRTLHITLYRVPEAAQFMQVLRLIHGRKAAEIENGSATSGEGGGRSRIPVQDC